MEHARSVGGEDGGRESQALPIGPRETGDRGSAARFEQAEEGAFRENFAVRGGVVQLFDELPDGASRLTIVHDLTGAPVLAGLMRGDMEAQGAGGGWNWVLSTLKTLLETGEELGQR